ncbi:MAG: MMPL family transporter [Actinomycetota bacterium]
MLPAIARFCFRHRWITSLIWALILGATIFFARTQGGTFANNFTLPGTESQRTFDLLKEAFPAQSGDTGQIVFKAEAGIAAAQQRMEAGFAAALATSDHILGITSPYSPAGERQVAAQGSDAGKVAFGEIQFNVPATELPEELSDQIQEAVNRAVRPDAQLQVEFGGFAFQEIAPPGGREERIGLAAAVLILLVAFGSVLAMGMSIGIALFSLGISLTGLTILANYLDVATFSPLIAAMIGLGVGIDYALFIVTRYRQELQEGRDPETSAVIAISTAGRAVLFAGITVIISLLGMFFMNLSFVNGLAIGAALAVLVTMLASVTLLPALMGMVGRHIDRLSIHFLGRNKPPKPKQAKLGYRWSRTIQRHPIPYMLLALVILGTLAMPAFAIRLGNQDAGNGPTQLTTRRAYDLLSDGFGPGYNGPLLIAAKFKAPESFAQLQALQQQLAADPGVAFVTPPVPNDPQNPTAALMQVIGKFAPQDVKTDNLVHHLRDDIIAPAAEQTGIVIHSGGPAAIGIDLTDKLTGRLPIFFGGVILLSFLLLMAAFRSILVPLKAAVMNVLAIGAAFGVLVAIFQWGWGAELIGIDRTGPIAAFSPMILFAILFGLSMDYEVFLLSRIKEEHERTGNNAVAVADGLASTARVITAAAAIMVTVFFSFVLGDEPNAKLVGLGLAVAILLDATVVRMILVPATMELLGEANWWLPRWLDRILPRIHIEGDFVAQPATVHSAGATERALGETLVHDEMVMPSGRTVTGVGILQTSKAGLGDYPPPTGAAPEFGRVAPTGAAPEFGRVETGAGHRRRAEPQHAPGVERVVLPGTSQRRPGGITVPRPAVQTQEAVNEGDGQPGWGDNLDQLLWNLPFKAGKATVQQNLEELLAAALVQNGRTPLVLDITRVSGYLELEQRFGRIRQTTEVAHAARLLMGALAVPGGYGGDYRRQAAAAVQIVLGGIKA